MAKTKSQEGSAAPQKGQLASHSLLGKSQGLQQSVDTFNSTTPVKKGSPPKVGKRSRSLSPRQQDSSPRRSPRTVVCQELLVHTDQSDLSPYNVSPKVSTKKISPLVAGERCGEKTTPAKRDLNTTKGESTNTLPSRSGSVVKSGELSGVGREENDSPIFVYQNVKHAISGLPGVAKTPVGTGTPIVCIKDVLHPGEEETREAPGHHSGLGNELKKQLLTATDKSNMEPTSVVKKKSSPKQNKQLLSKIENFDTAEKAVEKVKKTKRASRSPTKESSKSPMKESSRSPIKGSKSKSPTKEKSSRSPTKGSSKSSTKDGSAKEDCLRKENSILLKENSSSQPSSNSERPYLDLDQGVKVKSKKKRRLRPDQISIEISDVSETDGQSRQASPAEVSLNNGELEDSSSRQTLSPTPPKDGESLRHGRRIRSPSLRYADDMILFPLKSPRKSPKLNGGREGDSPEERTQNEKKSKVTESVKETRTAECQTSELYALLTKSNDKIIMPSRRKSLAAKSDSGEGSTPSWSRHTGAVREIDFSEGAKNNTRDSQIQVQMEEHLAIVLKEELARLRQSFSTNMENIPSTSTSDKTTSDVTSNARHTGDTKCETKQKRDMISILKPKSDTAVATKPKADNETVTKTKRDTVRKPKSVKEEKLQPSNLNVKGYKPTNSSIKGEKLKPSDINVKGEKLKPSDINVKGEKLKRTDSCVAKKFKPTNVNVGNEKFKPTDNNVGNEKLKPTDLNIGGEKLKPTDLNIGGGKLKPPKLSVKGNKVKPTCDTKSRVRKGVDTSSDLDRDVDETLGDKTECDMTTNSISDPLQDKKEEKDVAKDIIGPEVSHDDKVLEHDSESEGKLSSPPVQKSKNDELFSLISRVKSNLEGLSALPEFLNSPLYEPVVDEEDDVSDDGVITLDDDEKDSIFESQAGDIEEQRSVKSKLSDNLKELTKQPNDDARATTSADSKTVHTLGTDNKCDENGDESKPDQLTPKTTQQIDTLGGLLSSDSQTDKQKDASSKFGNKDSPVHDSLDKDRIYPADVILVDSATSSSDNVKNVESCGTPKPCTDGDGRQLSMVTSTDADSTTDDSPTRKNIFEMLMRDYQPSNEEQVANDDESTMEKQKEESNVAAEKDDFDSLEECGKNKGESSADKNSSKALLENIQRKLHLRESTRKNSKILQSSEPITVDLTNSDDEDNATGAQKHVPSAKAGPAARSSVQRCLEATSLDVLKKAEMYTPDTMAAFQSKSLDDYLWKTQNDARNQGHADDYDDDNDVYYDDNEEEEEEEEDEEEEQREFEEELEPDFDEVEGMVFMSFPSQETLSAHMEVERKTNIGKNDNLLLGISRLKNLRKKRERIQLKYNKRIRRLKTLKIEGQINQNLRGMHKAAEKYDKLYRTELYSILKSKNKDVNFKSPQKTSDITQIKGWKKKFGNTEELAEATGLTISQAGKLHWRTEARLLKNLKPNELKEIGLNLKKKRRKNLVFTIRKGMSKGDNRVDRNDDDADDDEGDEDGDDEEEKGDDEYPDEEDRHQEDSLFDDYNISPEKEKKSQYKKKQERLKKRLLLQSLSFGPEEENIIRKLGGQRGLRKSRFGQPADEDKAPVCDGEDAVKGKRGRKRKGEVVYMVTITESMALTALAALDPCYSKEKPRAPPNPLRSPAAPHPLLPVHKKEADMTSSDRLGLLEEEEDKEWFPPETIKERRIRGKKKKVIKEESLAQCTQPGCRYGCICHLCRFADPVPDGDSGTPQETPCDKEYCRLGCICDSIGARRRIPEGHCAKPECQLGCVCIRVKEEVRETTPDKTEDKAVEENKHVPRGVVQKRRETLPRRQSTYRLAKNLDAISRKAMFMYETSEMYCTEQKPAKRSKSKDVDDLSAGQHRVISTGPSSASMRPSPLGSSNGDGMSRYVITAGQIQSSTAPSHFKSGVKSPKQFTKEQYWKLSSKAAKRKSSGAKKKDEGGGRRTEFDDITFDEMLESDNEDYGEYTSCARTMVYNAFSRSKAKCTCHCGLNHQDGKSSETCLQSGHKSKSPASDVTQESSGSKSEHAKPGSSKVGDSFSPIVISPSNTPPSSPTHPQPGQNKPADRSSNKHSQPRPVPTGWHTQWVCLKTSKKKGEEDIESYEIRLLEMISNCNWENAKQKILSKISSQITRDTYPSPRQVPVSDYLISFLPRSNKPAMIPAEVKAKLPKSIFSIRIKVERKPVSKEQGFRARLGEFISAQEKILHPGTPLSQDGTSPAPTDKVIPFLVATSESGELMAPHIHPTMAQTGPVTTPTTVDMTTSLSMGGISGLSHLQINRHSQPSTLKLLAPATGKAVTSQPSTLKLVSPAMPMGKTVTSPSQVSLLGLTSPTSTVLLRPALATRMGAPSPGATQIPPSKYVILQNPTGGQKYVLASPVSQTSLHLMSAGNAALISNKFSCETSTRLASIPTTLPGKSTSHSTATTLSVPVTVTTATRSFPVTVTTTTHSVPVTVTTASHSVPVTVTAASRSVPVTVTAASHSVPITVTTASRSVPVTVTAASRSVPVTVTAASHSVPVTVTTASRSVPVTVTTASRSVPVTVTAASRSVPVTAAPRIVTIVMSSEDLVKSATSAATTNSEITAIQRPIRADSDMDNKITTKTVNNGLTSNKRNATDGEIRRVSCDDQELVATQSVEKGDIISQSISLKRPQQKTSDDTEKGQSSPSRKRKKSEEGDEQQNADVVKKKKKKKKKMDGENELNQCEKEAKKRKKKTAQGSEYCGQSSVTGITGDNPEPPTKKCRSEDGVGEKCDKDNEINAEHQMEHDSGNCDQTNFKCVVSDSSLKDSELDTRCSRDVPCTADLHSVILSQIETSIKEYENADISGTSGSKRSDEVDGPSSPQRPQATPITCEDAPSGLGVPTSAIVTHKRAGSLSLLSESTTSFDVDTESSEGGQSCDTSQNSLNLKMLQTIQKASEDVLHIIEGSKNPLGAQHPLLEAQMSGKREGIESVHRIVNETRPLTRTDTVGGNVVMETRSVAMTDTVGGNVVKETRPVTTANTVSDNVVKETNRVRGNVVNETRPITTSNKVRGNVGMQPAHIATVSSDIGLEVSHKVIKEIMPVTTVNSDMGLEAIQNVDGEITPGTTVSGDVPLEAVHRVAKETRTVTKASGDVDIDKNQDESKVDKLLDKSMKMVNSIRHHIDMSQHKIRETRDQTVDLCGQDSQTEDGQRAPTAAVTTNPIHESKSANREAVVIDLSDDEDDCEVQSSVDGSEATSVDREGSETSSTSGSSGTSSTSSSGTSSTSSSGTSSTSSSENSMDKEPSETGTSAQPKVIVIDDEDGSPVRHKAKTSPTKESSDRSTANPVATEDDVDILAVSESEESDIDVENMSDGETGSSLLRSVLATQGSQPVRVRPCFVHSHKGKRKASLDTIYNMDRVEFKEGLVKAAKPRDVPRPSHKLMDHNSKEKQRRRDLKNGFKDLIDVIFGQDENGVKKPMSVEAIQGASKIKILHMALSVVKDIESTESENDGKMKTLQILNTNLRNRLGHSRMTLIQMGMPPARIQEILNKISKTCKFIFTKREMLMKKRLETLKAALGTCAMSEAKAQADQAAALPPKPVPQPAPKPTTKPKAPSKSKAVPPIPIPKVVIRDPYMASCTAVPVQLVSKAQVLKMAQCNQVAATNSRRTNVPQPEIYIDMAEDSAVDIKEERVSDGEYAPDPPVHIVTAWSQHDTKLRAAQKTGEGEEKVDEEEIDRMNTQSPVFSDVDMSEGYFVQQDEDDGTQEDADSLNASRTSSDMEYKVIDNSSQSEVMVVHIPEGGDSGTPQEGVS